MALRANCQAGTIQATLQFTLYTISTAEEVIFGLVTNTTCVLVFAVQTLGNWASSRVWSIHTAWASRKFTCPAVEEVVPTFITLLTFIVALAVQTVFYYAPLTGWIHHVVIDYFVTLRTHSIHTVYAALHSAIQAFPLHHLVTDTIVAIQTIFIVNEVVLLCAIPALPINQSILLWFVTILTWPIDDIITIFCFAGRTTAIDDHVLREVTELTVPGIIQVVVHGVVTDLAISWCRVVEISCLRIARILINNQLTDPTDNHVLPIFTYLQITLASFQCLHFPNIVFDVFINISLTQSAHK